MKYTFVTGVAISCILLGGVLFFIAKSPTSKSDVVVSQKAQVAITETSNAENVKHTATSRSKYIKLISPNGGEVFKIGSAMSIAFEAASLPEGANLEIELFKVIGTSTLLREDGSCANCTPSDGLRGGIPSYSVVNGIGSTTWTAGKLYSGDYVQPGNEYILKATVTKTGFKNKNECPEGSVKGMCEIMYEIDWSDTPFSLVN